MAKIFVMHKYCYLEIIKWSTKQNSDSDVHRSYMGTRVNISLQLTDIQYINRVITLNRYSAYLPCFEQVRESLTVMTRADRGSYTDIEFVPIILSGLDSRLMAAFWVLKGIRHFPTSTQEMSEDLELIEPQPALSYEVSGKYNFKNMDNGKKFSGKRNGSSVTTPRKRDSPKGSSSKNQTQLC